MLLFVSFFLYVVNATQNLLNVRKRDENVKRKNQCGDGVERDGLRITYDDPSGMCSFTFVTVSDISDDYSCLNS